MRTANEPTWDSGARWCLARGWLVEQAAALTSSRSRSFAHHPSTSLDRCSHLNLRLLHRQLPTMQPYLLDTHTNFHLTPAAAAHFPSSRDVSHTLTLHHMTRLSLRATHFFFSFATASATPRSSQRHGCIHRPHMTAILHTLSAHVHTPQPSLRPSKPHSPPHTYIRIHSSSPSLHFHLNHALPPVVLLTLSLFPVHSEAFECPLTDTCVCVRVRLLAQVL